MIKLNCSHNKGKIDGVKFTKCFVKRKPKSYRPHIFVYRYKSEKNRETYVWATQK